MEGRLIDWLPGSFDRLPHWRMLRASYRLERGKARDPRVDDDGVELALSLLAPSRKSKKPSLTADVRTAFDLWTADQIPRWLLEAHLLTTQSFVDVAAACSLSEPVVHAFHELFFDVRSRLQAHDWIMSKAIGSGPLNNFVGPQPAGIWKHTAFTSGPRALDVVVAVTLDHPLPPWLRETFVEDPEWEEVHFRLKVKLVIATMTAKSDEQLGSVLELSEQLRELEEEAGLIVDDEHCLSAMSTFLTSLSPSGSAKSRASGHAPAKKGVVPQRTRPHTAIRPTITGVDYEE